MATALEGLDGTNRETWDLYQQVVTRLSADLHVGGYVLQQSTAHLSPVEFEDRWKRLVILYDTLQPPPEHKG